MTGWPSRWFLRARATFSPRHDRELRDELQLHLRLLEEEYTEQGMSPHAARRRAHQEFGNPTLVQEASHNLFTFRPLEDLGQDLRYAIRELRRSVGFTFIAVASLGLGIGAVTAAFAVVDAFMFRALPVREPERLVGYSTSDDVDWAQWPYQAFVRWRDSPDTRVAVAAASSASAERVPIGGGGVTEVRVSLVSADYFQVMGADMAIGRALAGTDGDAPGAAAIAVISDAFWARWFGRTTDVLGKTIDLHGVSYAVVGVARKGFRGHAVAQPSDVWIPITMQRSLMPDGPDLLGHDTRWLTIVGRLMPGVSVAQATAEANLVRQRFIAEKAAGLGETHPQIARDRKHSVVLLQARTGYAPERGRYARALLMLSGVTALVLLVACANFTNLMLARSEYRRREFVIRLALGGGRWRLIRQAATECIVLALSAGLLGWLFANWATVLFLKQFAVLLAPGELALELDARALAAAAACVAVVIVFGLWPCTRPARFADVASVHHSKRTGAGRTRAVAGRVLLVAQLAMCTILLIGAGLLLRTVTNLRWQDLGFDRNVLLVPMTLQEPGQSADAAALLLERIRERLTAVSGVRAVGVSGPPLMDYTTYWIDGSQQLATDRGMVLPGARWTFAAVGAGFFEAVGMSLVNGRSFAEHEARLPGDVVVINQSLARILFAADNPIGRQIRVGPKSPMQTVIGVVNDVKQTSPRDRALGVVYSPLRDVTRVVLAVRTAGPPGDAAPVIAHQLAAIAGDVPIGRMRTIGEALDEAIAQERLMSTISLWLAALAIAIGCVGLYALMSYDVAQRTHELGIRLALGATGAEVVTLVLRRSVSLVVPALAMGVPLGMAASRPLASYLYEVRTDDPFTLASVALLLALIALVATLKPARTASRIDPIVLLRSE